NWCASGLIDAVLRLQAIARTGRRCLRSGRHTGLARRWRRLLLLLLLLLLRLLTIGIALHASIRASRFCLWLKRFPNHLGFGVVLNRESAIDALTRRTVDAHPADSCRSDEWNLGLVGECGLGPLLEDRGRDSSALGIAPEAARLVVTEIDAGND